MLRICLIIAILAGLAAGAVSFFKIQEDILATRAARDDWNKKYHAEDQAHIKTKATLKKTTADLESTRKDLAQTKTDLEAANGKVEDLGKKATDLTAKLEKATGERDAAQEKLARWNSLPDPAEIRLIITDLENTRKTRDKYIADNKVLSNKFDNLQIRWNDFFGTNSTVPLPVGLRGLVLAVDPKFDFVVLNIGKEQGVLARGEMMVDRNGKLLGKVRIKSVEDNRCVANILPEWKRGEIMEGDEVLN